MNTAIGRPFVRHGQHYKIVDAYICTRPPIVWRQLSYNCADCGREDTRYAVQASDGEFLLDPLYRHCERCRKPGRAVTNRLPILRSDESYALALVMPDDDD
jgi:hypothetical protein